MREFEIIRRTYYPFPVKMLMTPNKLPTEVRLYSDVESPKVRLCERSQLFLKIDGEHTVKPTHRFQNTTRRLPKFPRTHRGDILPFVVVAKKHCAQILATMRALLYAPKPQASCVWFV